MIVTNVLALGVKLRGRREVGRLSVGERASLHALNAQHYVESLIRSEVFAIRRRQECGRWHIGYSRDVTHGDTVTRTGLDLLAIRENLSSAIIDEVIVGSERVGLPSSGVLVTVLLGPCIDGTLNESQRRLGIPVVVRRSIVVGRSTVVGRSIVVGRSTVIGCCIIIIFCWGRSALRPFAKTFVPLSGGESLTGKKRDDNNQSGENSGELHCVGC